MSFLNPLGVLIENLVFSKGKLMSMILLI
jgi:hypothetical protein